MAIFQGSRYLVYFNIFFFIYLYHTNDQKHLSGLVPELVTPQIVMKISS